MKLDVVIIGGGAAGLWILDALTRRGLSVLLLESRALGSGQTINSQGIIHGGMKYALKGLMSRSARAIAGMPSIWKDCLLGKRPPILTHTRLRAEYCYLWRNKGITSRLTLLGARLCLKSSPTPIPRHAWPALLSHASEVCHLPEQVICPYSMLQTLQQQYYKQLLLVRDDPVKHRIHFSSRSVGEVKTINIISDGGDQLELQPRHVILAAGAGNNRLREMLGLDPHVMQRRALHMVMLRGRDLPPLCGHMIDKGIPLLTITSDIDSNGSRIWQIGGQIAEDGVALTAIHQASKTYEILRATFPTLNFDNVEWTTYRIDRAEAATSNGTRPHTIQILQEGNVITVWPTKLALVPALALEIVKLLPTTNIYQLTSSDSTSSLLQHWPRPQVAPLPWNAPSCMWHMPDVLCDKRHLRAA